MNSREPPLSIEKEYSIGNAIANERRTYTRIGEASSPPCD
jgi:hypothetical protein